jgi:hypothetical protein
MVNSCSVESMVFQGPGEQPMMTDHDAGDGNRQHDDRLERLLKRFAVAARAHHEALEALDAERAEAQARMVAGLHEALVRERKEGEELLLNLVDSLDPVVAGRLNRPPDLPTGDSVVSVAWQARVDSVVAVKNG